jgi:diguanylate cyclase (GGDEF)-like protein/PAS domain S-box-containing protein
MSDAPYPVRDGEDERLAALAAYKVVNTPPEKEYDHIARLAADLFQAPVAMVAVVDRDTKWIKGRVGTEADKIDRKVAFCSHTIISDDVLVVPDLREDPRFAANPLVLGDPHARFYAGAPLVDPAGHKLGTLCVLDHKPRPSLNPEQRKLLRDLAGLVMDRLELRRLQAVEQFALEMTKATSDAVVCATGDGTITFWNRGAENLFGYSPGEAVGRRLDIIIPAQLQAAHRFGMLRVQQGGEPKLVGRSVEVPARRKDGSQISIEMSLALWRDGEELVAGAIIRDVSERRRTEERLKELAHYDQLTGLPNRLLFQETLAAAAAGGAAASLLLLDLDRFKDVNDTLGHQAGDLLLVEVAERIQTLVAPQDTVVRLGADEFGILLPECGDPRLAAEKAAAIMEAFSAPFNIDRSLFHVGTSIGVALCPGLCNSVDELMAGADLALRLAKTEGGGRYEFFQPTLREQLTARHSLEAELRRAFDNGELQLYYQPQVRLSDGIIEGAEALLRWQHPERGLLAPGVFMHVLETISLATTVGEWALKTGCAFAAGLAREGLPGIRLGVNLFAAQFRSGNIVQSVIGALEQSGLHPADLELEITENIVLRHDDAMTAPLRELRALGVGLAFDDYGTGYASLSMLKRFPITRLKIDREFIRDLVTDPDDAAIVRAVLALGKSLGFEVIAEGIETREQAAFLAAHDCEEGQGYYYGKPMPGHEFARLLAKDSVGDTSVPPRQLGQR